MPARLAEMELDVVDPQSKDGGEDDDDRPHGDCRRGVDVEVVHSSRNLVEPLAAALVALLMESFACYFEQSCWKVVCLPFPWR